MKKVFLKSYKWVFALICFFAFFIMMLNILSGQKAVFARVGEGYRESYSSEVNMKLAREIAAMTAARQVAVIGDNDGVLVGISLEAGTGERNALQKKARAAVEEYYPKAKVLVEIQSEEAEEIIELAESMNRGIPNWILASKIEDILDD